MIFEIFLKFSDSLVFLGFKTWNYTVRWLVNGTILKGFDAMAPFFGALLVFSSTLSWWEMVQILSRWEMVLFWRSRGRFLTRRISFQRRQNSEWWGHFTFPDLEAFYIHPWPFWNHFHVHCILMYAFSMIQSGSLNLSFMSNFGGWSFIDQPEKNHRKWETYKLSFLKYLKF